MIFEREYFKNYCFFSKADGKDNRLLLHNKFFYNYIFNIVYFFGCQSFKTLYSTMVYCFKLF